MARGFNRVIIIGNLTKDPKLQYTPQGTPVCKVVIATNRKYKNQHGETCEDVDFIPVVIWGRNAENCDTYQKKGDALLVEGRISTRNYTNREGEKRYVTEVIAQLIQFMPKGRKNQEEHFENSEYRDGGGYEPSIRR